jgi:hypothetical protein
MFAASQRVGVFTNQSTALHIPPCRERYGTSLCDVIHLLARYTFAAFAWLVGLSSRPPPLPVTLERCSATTKSGRRCLNNQLRGSEFCAVHKSRINVAKALAIGAGVAVGNVVAPGVGGAAVGGFIGWLIHKESGDKRMAKKRVFISFDYDNDRVLKDFLLGQAKHEDSPFDVINHSLKEEAPQASWEKTAKAAIARSDVMLAMVGANTHRASGVLKEVAMAREAGVKIVQIIGYKGGTYTAVPNAGKLYTWSWDNLKALLA